MQVTEKITQRFLFSREKEKKKSNHKKTDDSIDEIFYWVPAPELLFLSYTSDNLFSHELAVIIILKNILH